MPAPAHRTDDTARFRWPLLLVLPAAALLPSEAAGQSHFQVKPSLGLVQVYDDNLFSSASVRQEDFILRLSPLLGAGWTAANWSVLARCAVDAEFFRRHPELNTPWARQEASILLRYLPVRRLTFTASASYSHTQTAGEFNLITGFQTARAPASRFHTSQSLSVAVSAVTKATLDHTFSRDQLSDPVASARPGDLIPDPGASARTGGVISDRVASAQVVVMSLERQFGAADRGSLGYGRERFAFGPESTTSHLLTVGWTREITPQAHFEFKAGPRLSGRSLGADISAGLRYRLRSGHVALTYLQTQTTVVGHPGAVTAAGVSATFRRQLWRSLRVEGGPSAFQSRGEAFSAMVYRMSLGMAWQLTRQLSLAGSHYLTVQRGGLEGGPRGDISHNSLLLSLVAASAGS